VLLGKYPCDTKDELLTRERYHTNNIECINQRKNQGICHEIGEKEYQKQYHEKNKDVIYAKHNEKHDCICGSKYTKAFKKCKTSKVSTVSKVSNYYKLFEYNKSTG